MNEHINTIVRRLSGTGVDFVTMWLGDGDDRGNGAVGWLVSCERLRGRPDVVAWFDASEAGREAAEAFARCLADELDVDFLDWLTEPC